MAGTQKQQPANHDSSKHGDHKLTFYFEATKEVESARAQTKAKQLKAVPDKTGTKQSETLPERSVIGTEREAIALRRRRTKDLPLPAEGAAAVEAKRKDRSNSPYTGLALSGGGIRSASFGLGALQVLDVAVGIEGVDYLSTVSGGGYVGCALTATMQKTEGKFPFTEPKTRADTASVRHIRDYSNYLIPHGGADVITALGIMARELVANAMIVLPLIFFLVGLTLVAHPDVASLGQPNILFWNLATLLKRMGVSTSDPLWGIPGFWFTIVILAFDLVFLIVWTFWKSITTSQLLQLNSTGDRNTVTSAELQGGFARCWKFLFLLTVICAWCEAQPFILYYAFKPQQSVANACFSLSTLGECFGTLLHGWITRVTP
jgi:hypothetical protein